MLKLDYELARYLIDGATILATGGGGDPELGLELLMRDIDRGLQLCICDPAETSGLTCSAYICGPMPKPGEKDLHISDDVIKIVLEYLRSIRGIVPTELGGYNTAIAIHISSILGVPTLDCDQVGRAAPELIHTTYYLNGVCPWPSLVVTPRGDVLEIKKCVNIFSYEDIVRNISEKHGGVLVLDSFINSVEVSSIAVKRTLSMSIEVGKIVNTSKEPIRDLIRRFGGFLVFRGIVDDVNLEVKHGFLQGRVTYRGIGEFYGHNLEILVKNENIAAFRDGKPVVLPPDLICVLDENYKGLTNNRVERGLKVWVIAFKAPEIWRTEKGLELFGPRHFGLDIDYVPVEELIR
ncbi:MAG: DUF917 domain-containing protein [Crenarchaeota archaeon]|nr:DUF917 domain-containing protein [Thermoproteota archaeon]